MRLSIITPYYNSLKYTLKLAEVLEPQLNDEIEWIIVDDGCNEKELDKLKAKVIHLEKNSGGASRPRNVGLDIATGDYIAFIDSDDLVTEDYIKRIMPRLKYDMIFLNWRRVGYSTHFIYKPARWNCSVWCRIYKREIIGNIRFDEKLIYAEDWKFNEQIKFKTATVIKQHIYIYNKDNPSSLTTRRK